MPDPRPALDYDLVLTGHTTARVDDVRFARWLADALRGLFALDDLDVTWLPPGRVRAATRRWSALSGAELEAVYGQGGIALSDPGGQVCSGGITWNRVPRRERAQFLDNQGYRQNELVVRTDAARLADRDFRDAYLRLARDAAAEFAVTYLIAHNPLATPARQPTAAGLGAGLRAVHWLNVFGAPFVAIVGTERLLSAPAAHAEELPSGHVLLLCDDDALDVQRAASATATVRAHLGEEFFATDPGSPRERPGVTGLGGLVGTLRRGAKRFSSTAGDAAVRPTFDYSEILLED